MNSKNTSLRVFIGNIYENITGIGGKFRDITIGHPSISQDCDDIVKSNEEKVFIDLNQASVYKKCANIAIHILYASPLKTPISREPLNQCLKIEEFKILKATPNHQNAIIAIFYALHLLNQEQETKHKIKISCHSMIEIDLDDKNENNLYQFLIASTRYLALLFEQVVYKNNANLQYELCPTTNL
ncbi:hypothetical protein [Bathymodiolus thermophilus thioautotrophic gill symbiont]|uniref:Uncharacterized protein n=1 Tax=Bathymodiolus thermophilus thioautotrophic gill symbiont TaxID=2360 RepID=A0A8H9CHP8_9GAMM|nr:hypothetical protein [Bathymodiolus thermophilus thioautotrophic gill symbiont]CAB5505510.1 hypothetical protein THERMOS_2140 [Bathymodiolus thermophilus thioautotrophic gill symbiont]